MPCSSVTDDDRMASAHLQCSRLIWYLSLGLDWNMRYNFCQVVKFVLAPHLLQNDAIAFCTVLHSSRHLTVKMSCSN